jgi:competence protein ComEA
MQDKITIGAASPEVPSKMFAKDLTSKRGQSAQAKTSAPAFNSDAGKVNINTATSEELEKLPRIGPAFAQRIIDYRKANGNFKNIEEIQKVKGIGPATYAGMKNQITVGGSSNSPEKILNSSSTNKPSPAKVVKPAPAKPGPAAQEAVKPVRNSPVKSGAKAKSSNLININTATISELTKLPGIGTTYAQRIIEYRKSHGPFQSLEDITKVKGIGPKTLEKMRPLATAE